MENLNTDILIIGAGPSGTVAAAMLNQEGFDVMIVEKTTFPRFVIGESLLPRCMDILGEANLLEAIEKESFQKKYGAIFMQGEDRCDFDFNEQYSNGSTWTWQVPRANFDKALADEVESRGVNIRYNTSVTDVVFEKDQVRTIIESGQEKEEILSRYVIDGSGYGRVLPRLLNLDKPSNLPPRSAFFTHVNDADREKHGAGNRIEVVVVEPNTWIWIIPFSDGTTSLGVVGDLSFIDSDKSNTENFRDMLNSNDLTAGRFKNAEFVFEPRRIDGYSAAVKEFYGPRFVLTGNSTEFLDPIFSSGVTFAVESGAKAARLIARELRNETVNWEKEYVAYIQQGVDVFRSYVNAWYDGSLPKIFFAKRIDQGIKERICSVLAGYVWDTTNNFVKKHGSALGVLAKVVDIQEKAASKA